MLIPFWRYIYIISKIKGVKKTQNSRNQGFPSFFCLLMEGSGSVQINYESGCGFRRPQKKCGSYGSGTLVCGNLVHNKFLLCLEEDKNIFFVTLPLLAISSDHSSTSGKNWASSTPIHHHQSCATPHPHRLDVSAEHSVADNVFGSSISGQCGSRSSRPKSMYRIYADPDPEHWLRIRCHPHPPRCFCQTQCLRTLLRIQHFRSMRIRSRIQPTKINKDLCRSRSGTLVADPVSPIPPRCLCQTQCLRTMFSDLAFKVNAEPDPDPDPADQNQRGYCAFLARGFGIQNGFFHCVDWKNTTDSWLNSYMYVAAKNSDYMSSLPVS